MLLPQSAAWGRCSCRLAICAARAVPACDASREVFVCPHLQPCHCCSTDSSLPPLCPQLRLCGERAEGAGPVVLRGPGGQHPRAALPGAAGGRGGAARAAVALCEFLAAPTLCSTAAARLPPFVCTGQRLLVLHTAHTCALHAATHTHPHLATSGIKGTPAASPMAPGVGKPPPSRAAPRAR